MQLSDQISVQAATQKSGVTGEEHDTRAALIKLENSTGKLPQCVLHHELESQRSRSPAVYPWPARLRSLRLAVHRPTLLRGPAWLAR